jgi:hypothetical protein
VEKRLDSVAPAQIGYMIGSSPFWCRKNRRKGIESRALHDRRQENDKRAGRGFPLFFIPSWHNPSVRKEV